MQASVLDARTTRAIGEVAREQGLELLHWRLYASGDAVITFANPAHPGAVAALLPVDRTLRASMRAGCCTRAELRRILRADAFSGDASRDGARDLCRFGLVGCHALAEALGADRPGHGLHVRVLFDAPGVEVVAETGDAVRVTIGPDLVRLLEQFRPVDRYGRAYHACRRQLWQAGAYRSSS